MRRNYIFEREPSMSPGEKLRAFREKLGFTLKDVEIASLQLVQKYNSGYLRAAFAISRARGFCLTSIACKRLQ